MNQGTKRFDQYLRRLPLLALVLGLSALSLTGQAAIEPPPPSDAQCALIEVHDNVGIGWWSSPALEIVATAPEDGGN